MDAIYTEAFYATAKREHHEIDDATIAVRRFGSGPALLLIHGFPVHGYTWRALLPKLAQRHTCFVLDLPGLGNSEWNGAADFTFTGQAHRLSPLLRVLGIDRRGSRSTGVRIPRASLMPHEERPDAALASLLPFLDGL